MDATPPNNQPNRKPPAIVSTAPPGSDSANCGFGGEFRNAAGLPFLLGRHGTIALDERRLGDRPVDRKVQEVPTSALDGL